MSDNKPYIRYSQCWEDVDILLESLEINNADTVLSVTSGGCNTFAIMAQNPAKVFTIDSNNTQTYLFELKQAAIQQLPQKEVLEFLGYTRSSRRVEFFNTIENTLSLKAKNYWTQNISLVKQGVIHIGKFEKYLRVFRTRILPLIHSKTTIQNLFRVHNKNQQVQYFNTSWNTWRWRFVFRIFFSARIMKALGRHKEMFAFNPHYKPAELYLERTKNALLQGPIQHNFYLEYILLGEHKTIPYFLTNDACKKISDFKNVEVSSQNIFEFLQQAPDNSISKFNVSDVFEPLSKELTQELFREIYRVAKNGARILFWNNLVSRKPEGELTDKFVLDAKKHTEVKNKNKVFFYDSFYIMTIKK